MPLQPHPAILPGTIVAAVVPRVISCLTIPVLVAIPPNGIRETTVPLPPLGMGQSEGLELGPPSHFGGIFPAVHGIRRPSLPQLRVSRYLKCVKLNDLLKNTISLYSRRPTA